MGMGTEEPYHNQQAAVAAMVASTTTATETAASLAAATETLTAPKPPPEADGAKDERYGHSLFSQVERAVLKALFIDPPSEPAPESSRDEKEESGNGTGGNGAASDVDWLVPKKSLSDEMLLHVPPNLGELCEQNSKSELQTSKTTKAPVKFKEPHEYRMQVGLWQAHEDGVTADELKNFNNPHRRTSALLRINAIKAAVGDEKETLIKDGLEGKGGGQDEDGDADSIDSDRKLLPDRPSARKREAKVALGEAADDDERSDSSSWAEGDGGFEHFDAWEVLKDEYAGDFGFDYKPNYSIPETVEGGLEIEKHQFKILGTSADDISAHPHVLSPPLIDALLYFVPDSLEFENMWLKYSLIRDGACMDTFKRYVRASPNTIVAIETTTGHVFGSFTSSPWRTSSSLYGGQPSFLWKMRHSRLTPCHSLIEQAQLESEIDVYTLIGNDHLVQYCFQDMIGVGEGEVNRFGDLTSNSSSEQGETHSFGIAVTDDLLKGITSRCSSYKSPCLIDPSSESQVFDVLNLEVWTMTPCFNVDSAEKLEMKHYFVHEESVRRLPSSHSASLRGSSRDWTSDDFSQDKFYRRIGQDDPGEHGREGWSYRNMMDSANNSGPGAALFGASPRSLR